MANSLNESDKPRLSERAGPNAGFFSMDRLIIQQTFFVVTGEEIKPLSTTLRSSLRVELRREGWAERSAWERDARWSTAAKRVSRRALKCLVEKHGVVLSFRL